MDIATFSQTYWYIWFILSLLIVGLLIINAFGIPLYLKRRKTFLNKMNQTNENVQLNEICRRSTTNISRSRYKPMPAPSATISDLAVRQTTNRTNSRQKQLHTLPIYETNRQKSVKTHSPTPSEETSKSEIDLSLEEFQRQALKEHNTMRAMYKKPPLKLSDSLNIYAQYWADKCAQTHQVVPSRPEWRLHCKGQPLGENIVAIRSTNELDGAHFTALVMANGNSSREVDCVLNNISTEVGFGRACYSYVGNMQEQQWIGVAHYYPYRQLTAVQS